MLCISSGQHRRVDSKLRRTWAFWAGCFSCQHRPFGQDASRRPFQGAVGPDSCFALLEGISWKVKPALLQLPRCPAKPGASAAKVQNLLEGLDLLAGETLEGGSSQVKPACL